ncbi:MAG TPA: ROK family transcriptional regulator [Candidatus Angelobacter sp.]|nr:ROK family transcriptional regulator [Candidatus Angelobacter sp.]
MSQSNGSFPENGGEPATQLPDFARGTNQSGVRLYNERLALSLIRRHGSLPKAEIARLTGLSAQTVSMIIKQLEADGLVLKEKPKRGRIGQPPVPISLNPDGAYSLGLKIGRRSADLMLLDLVGGIRGTTHRTFRYPTPEHTIRLFEEGFDTVTRNLQPRQIARICGVGIAAPFEIWNWENEIGAPHDVLQEWRGFDIKEEIAKTFRGPVHLCNDATAACAAELTFGKGDRYRDYVYFFIGSFAGGGIVLNGSLFQGRTSNAGALGSMAIPTPGAMGKAQQLIRSASIYVLENKLAATGLDPMLLWQNGSDWEDFGKTLDDWIDEAASGLAVAALSAVAVLDCEAVIIDGAIPAAVRSRLVKATREKIDSLDRQGLSPFTVVEGTIGGDARVLGGASVPLLSNFAIDRDVLFKEMPDERG